MYKHKCPYKQPPKLSSIIHTNTYYEKKKRLSVFIAKGLVIVMVNIRFVLDYKSIKNYNKLTLLFKYLTN